MSNVIALTVPHRVLSPEARIATLLDTFTGERRFGDDVFWLKENAELLNILECTGQAVSADALQAHAGFYTAADARLAFFPQYYRFLLSITLDLEDLGMPGTKAEAMIDWLIGRGTARAELSDLQRMEARRLMLRRGRDPLPDDPGLEDRMRRFLDHSPTFAVPNKKAAYELTHAVFYLSEYGRRDPQLGPETVTSLIFAGILAHLDLNADLLAEICVSLRYAGVTPPRMWEDWIIRETRRFAVSEAGMATAGDAYHEYLVSSWACALAGQEVFTQVRQGGALRFDAPPRPQGPLRGMSEALLHLGPVRCPDWEAMRGSVTAHMGEEAHAVLAAAEAATPDFPAFFSHFARAAAVEVAA